MELNLTTFLIVCPLVFLSGLVDAIGGGGGLISLPAYIFAGLPMHLAIGTNKLSSAIGTTVSTVRYVRHTKIEWKTAIPAIVLSLVGSACGANLALFVSEDILKKLMLVILPIAAFFVFRKNSFTSDGRERSALARKAAVWIAAFTVGAYDGFYGPGAGTFALIILIGFAGLASMEAAATTKLINLTSNVVALITFLINGKVIWELGLVAAIFSVAGHFLGSSLVLKNGDKIIRPIILVMLALLFVKVISDLL